MDSDTILPPLPKRPKKASSPNGLIEDEDNMNPHDSIRCTPGTLFFRKKKPELTHREDDISKVDKGKGTWLGLPLGLGHEIFYNSDDSRDDLHTNMKPHPGAILASYLYSTSKFSEPSLENNIRGYPFTAQNLEGAITQLKDLQAWMDHVSYKEILLAFREDSHHNRALFGALLRVWNDQRGGKVDAVRDTYGRILLTVFHRMFHGYNPNRKVQAMVFIESVDDLFTTEITAVQGIPGIGGEITKIVLRLLDCLEALGPPINIKFYSAGGTVQLDQEYLFRRTCNLLQILADKIPYDKFFFKSVELFLGKKHSEYSAKWEAGWRNHIEACAYAAKVTPGAPKPPKPSEIDQWDRVAMDMLRLQLTISRDPNYLILRLIPERDGRDKTQSNKTGRLG